MTIAQRTDDNEVPILRASKDGSTQIFAWKAPDGTVSQCIDTAIVAGFNRNNIEITEDEEKQMREAVSDLHK